jgi:hypothetical protein
MRDVQIIYKCTNLRPHDSLHDIQELVNSAVERLLAKLRHSYIGDGPLTISIEQCQGECYDQEVMDSLRCLKVCAEGHDPCVVMVY